MDNKELKKHIINNTLSDVVLVLKWSDSKYLAKQYVDAIAKNKKLTKVYIDKLSDMSDSDSFFDMEPTNLYIYEIDSLKEDITPDLKNLIVISKNIPDNLSVDYIEMTKLLNWQIEDFIKMRLSGLTEQEVIWLCQICKYDIYRLDQECKKLESFNPVIQESIFRQMNAENAYYDLSPNNIFDFTNAVMKKDYKKVGELIPELDSADLEPLGVVTTLIKNFKKIANLQILNKPTPGMSDKQFWYLKSHECGIYTNDEIINNIEFLTGIDSTIKSGNLELNREQLLGYIVANVL